MAEPQPAGSLIRNENYLSYCDLVKRAVDVNRIASDEYFRVRKSYKDLESHPIYRNRNYYDNYRIRRCLVPPKRPTLAQIREGGQDNGDFLFFKIFQNFLKFYNFYTKSATGWSFYDYFIVFK